MTEVNPEDMLEETIKTLKHDDFENVKWLTTGLTSSIAVETKNYDVTVFHPGVVRFANDGSLAIAGEGLPFMVIAAGVWQSVTVVDDEEENA